MRASFPLSAIFIISGALRVFAEAQIFGMPMRLGDDVKSSVSVGQFVNCLKHGPIPLTLSNVSNQGGNIFLVRMANDLEQYNMTFKVRHDAAQFVKLDRDNGAVLTAPQDLKRFVDRICGQAKYNP